MFPIIWILTRSHFLLVFSFNPHYIQLVYSFLLRIYCDHMVNSLAFRLSHKKRALINRYLITGKKGLINLEILALDIDGEECEGYLICFPRPVTTETSECPYDYLRIYDGENTTSPVIATLCGRCVPLFPKLTN